MSTPTHDQHREITRKVYEYAYGIDTRDFDLYRSIFADEIKMDFSSYNGGPPSTMAAGQWVAGVQVLFTGLDATQHVMTNPLVDVDGESARCRMYMKAEHLLVNDQGGDYFTIGGYYDDVLRSTDDTWLIEAVTLHVWWSRGNRHIMELARNIGRQKLAGGQGPR